LLFYFPHLLQKFAPWSLLVIGLLVVALRKTKATRGKWLAELSPEMFFLVAWVAGGIALMSFILSKRVDRIFPVVPALSSPGCATEGDQRCSRPRLAVFTIIFAAIFTGTCSGMRMIDGNATIATHW
jgi:hypothetical protein